jgi:hypothetical protein
MGSRSQSLEAYESFERAKGTGCTRPYALSKAAPFGE